MQGVQRIIVVGAGFAGISCARALQARGHDVTVLEARDRIGGRTRSEALGNITVDVGGQWIGAGHQRLRAQVEAAGLPIRAQYVIGSKLLDVSSDAPGRIRKYRGLLPRVSLAGLLVLAHAVLRINRMARQIDPVAPWDCPRARQWDACTVAGWADRHLPHRDAREAFDIAVRALLTTEPAAISLLHFLTYCAANGGFEALTGTRGGAQAEVVFGGMPAVAAHMAAPLTGAISLNAAVTHITQHDDGVTVQTEAGSHHGARVVITVPPSLLDGIAFSPELPVARRRLAAQMPMGAVIKAVIAYPTPFWRSAGLSGEAVSHRLPFNTVFDASWPESAGGALVGFFDGQPALDAADASEAERRQQVIDSLVHYFGPQAATPTGYVEHNWLTDPWARGGYTGVFAPGVLSTLGPHLRRPCGHIHWAGTETARAWNGYIEGAIESGERAAEEVHATLT